MRIMYERCCGLDIHKASIAACALISEKGTPQEETRRFGTMTADLRELSFATPGRSEKPERIGP